MESMTRLPQTLLIISTLLACWLGMQAAHELGHVLAAKLSGGEVQQVVLSPLTISRTDLGNNPHPLLVVWAGPICGVLLPLLFWALAKLLWPSGAFLLRFFAGFCLIANGLYIGLGSFGRIGDCGEMLRHGAALWQLWLFGLCTAPLGMLLWNKQGRHFGLGDAKGKVNRTTVYVSVALCVTLLVLGFAVGGS